MANTVHSFEQLCETLANRSYDRPPAIVCNAHITALAVSRSLDAHDVPVIALDREREGVAPYSAAVDCAGLVTYPLVDEEGFRDDIETLANHLDHEPVVFPCMDEWALALARTDPQGVHLPFADFETVEDVLDKSRLYERAVEAGIPIPETYRLDETDPSEAADALGFPLVVKPAFKRRFEEAFGTNLVEATDHEEYHNIVEQAHDAGIRVLAQERIPKDSNDLYTLGSYVPRSGTDTATTFIGNRRAIYPPEYGTTCLVERADAPEVRAQGLEILNASNYYGISEAEFLYDVRTDEYCLLDVNTRPWKWIGLPIAAGADLPVAAYTDVVGDSYEPTEITDARWVYLRDYLALVSNHQAHDELNRGDWLSLISGEFETNKGLTTAIYSPTDPDPSYQLLTTEFSDQEYYCAC
jgi:D-aspartate ligase